MIADGSTANLIYFVPAVALVIAFYGLMIITGLPRREGDLRAIDEWAEREGFKVIDVDDPGMLDGLRHPLTSRFENVYLVSLKDKSGSVRRGRALVGHRITVWIIHRVRVQWIK